MSKIIYIDTETCCFPESEDIKENDELLIQLAYSLVENDIMSFENVYCKNQLTIRPSAMAIHGITPERLVNEPYIRNTDEYIRLKNLDDDMYVIAHNLPFDKEIMRREGIESIQPYISTKPPSSMARFASSIPANSNSIQKGMIN